MDSNNFETVFIHDEIAKCEDIKELREAIFPMLRTQQEQWSQKINEIISTSGLTKAKFAEICGVSRVSIDKWCKGSIPKNRETFLRIGMAAGYGREKMDQLLQRYGRYPGLYVKSMEDCICAFVSDRGYGKETLSKYYYILNRIKERIIADNPEPAGNMETVLFDEKLSSIKDEDELERFISENSEVFTTAYNKFYAYVKMNLAANYESFNGSVYELAEAQGWSSSLKQCVSAIRQNKWYPTRNKIISLGLHLSMDHEQIDEMLKLAHMEPLCAKNVFESVIMFVLYDASLNNMLDRESEEFDSDDLFQYAREVLENFDLPEINSFITELSETDDDW